MHNKIAIEKVEIKNYRLCQNTIFSPKDDLSALIGPNGCGKTTVLKSLLLLKLLAREDNYIRRWSDDSDEEKVAPSEIKVHLNIDGKRIIHKSEIEIDTDNSNDDNIISSKQTWHLSKITGSKKHVNIPVSMLDLHRKQVQMRFHGEHFLDERRMYRQAYQLFKEPKVKDVLSEVAHFYRGITYYSASKFTNPSLCPVSFEIEEDGRRFLRMRDNNNHTKWLMDLYKCWKERPDEFEVFVSVVGKDGIGLIENFTFTEMTASKVDISVRVQGKIHKRNKENIIVVPHIQMNESTLLSPSQLSEGTFKTLGMIFYLMTGKNTLILLEEPEVCIHHGLLASIIELIKICSKDKQVVVSTHSDYVLDSLAPESIHVVKKDKECGVSVTPLKSFLSPNDKSALKQFLETEGNLGEFWRSGGFDD